MSSNAMADCVFPEDIMVCILKRVPVKSIVRFKSVCKPWLFLLSSSGFKKLHQDQFSKDPRNQSFIIHKRRNNLSLFKIGPNEKKPMILDHPFSHKHPGTEFVGCCNGLICFAVPPHGNKIHLWNPALMLSKKFSPLEEYEPRERVSTSLGFGYDAVGCDFKVVRIVCTDHVPDVDMYVEVYSVNSHSWFYIKPDLMFTVTRRKSDLIVNGNPYWVSTIYRSATVQKASAVLVYFDVTKLIFKVVPLSDDILSFLREDENAKMKFIDYNGCVGALVLTKDKECVVWVFDDSEQVWRENRTYGVIDVNVHHIWQWTKDGKIIGQRTDGQLFVFDTETRCVEELFYGGLQRSFDVLHQYTENMTDIEGMRPVKARTRTSKMIDDENEDEQDDR